MADKPAAKRSYIKEVADFYFAPDIRSIGTLAYLGVFGYFTLYHVDNLFLAVRFLLYVILGHTALTGVAFLFTGMAFVVALVLPFFISFYSIFVLHRVWDKPTWAAYVKWLMTILIALGSTFVIIVSDSAARISARQPSMQSFVEDANIANRI
ncbi:MAG TPA: hypothetical protein VHC46_06280 [Thermodesulfobacteriota bacterium]|nr:hypothetical protein [Candidatus Paceibacterota bacterium]HVY55346.1 hypothetical protein [Thermodesulfobacteriota bacterium]